MTVWTMFSAWLSISGLGTGVKEMQEVNGQRISILRTLLFAILFVAAFNASADEASKTKKTVSDEEQTEAGSPFVDRWAFKTNAFEWILTIPNFGVEFDLVNSPYNQMTVGLNAKYNWNTYHKLAPPVVFNLLDVRPEFRYYYRTTERKPKAPGDTAKLTAKEWFDQKIFTNERKTARPWRAQYIGAYVNYASYTFKLSKTGIQGHVVGLGATAGYALPMYQYKKGAIDVELGFSVGLQVCTREKFGHNPDTNKYYENSDESRGFHFTPFPVVSELRVAFVWRHKSIKDKVQEDVEKKKMQERLERARKQVQDPFVDAKSKFDEQLGWTMDPPEIEKLKSDVKRYREEFMLYLEGEVSTLTEVVIPQQLISDKMKEELSSGIEPMRIKAVKEFDKAVGFNPKAKEPKAKEPKAENGKTGKQKKEGTEKTGSEKKEKAKAGKPENANASKSGKATPNTTSQKTGKADKVKNVTEKHKAGTTPVKPKAEKAKPKTENPKVEKQKAGKIKVDNVKSSGTGKKMTSEKPSDSANIKAAKSPDKKTVKPLKRDKDAPKDEKSKKK